MAGSWGSADTVRDIPGFAVRFYTEEGNFDLVGKNMPVLFIQDGIKFPRPDPHGEARTRSQDPASRIAARHLLGLRITAPRVHMQMWVMSDRAIPRSYRTMDGFGVHTFRLVADDEPARS